jgi:predicted nucleic acid-binding protein
LAVLNITDKTGLTTYDASYLWLAGCLKGELITLDRKMQRAAKSYSKRPRKTDQNIEEVRNR